MFNVVWHGDNGKLYKSGETLINRFPLPLPNDKITFEIDYPLNNMVKSIINGKSKFLKQMHYKDVLYYPSIFDYRTIIKLSDGSIKDNTNGCINGVLFGTNKIVDINVINHGDFLPPCDTQYAYFKHFATKSLEEFITIKMKRGWPEGNLFGMEYYWSLNEKAKEKEELAKKIGTAYLLVQNKSKKIIPIY